MLGYPDQPPERRILLLINFRAAAADEHFHDLTRLLDLLPGEGKVSDLLGAYGTEQVVFNFPRVHDDEEQRQLCLYEW